MSAEKIRNAVAWIEALLAERWQVRRYSLGRDNLAGGACGRCCLGVAREVLGTGENLALGRLSKTTTERLGLFHVKQKTLTRMNDQDRAPHAEIGRYLIDHAADFFEPETAQGVRDHFAQVPPGGNRIGRRP